MIYLDHAATTPIPQAVADEMYRVLTQQFGNPSSQYPLGQDAKKMVEGYRAVIAGAVGCQPKELHFTSCGTESDNWAIQAALWQNRHVGKHIITTTVEHSAVLETCRALEQQGYEVTYLKPDKTGHITAQQVGDALREDTAVVSVMLVNNETGCVFRLAEIAAILKARKSRALLHTDAVQGFMKVPCDPKTLGVDMMSLSAHKIGGPKGIGALYVGPNVRNIRPLLHGGGQEEGTRSGTEATAQIAGFAKAAELRADGLADKLAQGLLYREAPFHRRRSGRGSGRSAPYPDGVAGGLPQRQRGHRSGEPGHLPVGGQRLPPGQVEPRGDGAGAGQAHRQRRAADQLRPGNHLCRDRRPVRGAFAAQKHPISYAMR